MSHENILQKPPIMLHVRHIMFVFNLTVGMKKKPQCVTSAQYFNYRDRYDERIWPLSNGLSAISVVLYHRSKDTTCSARV